MCVIDDGEPAKFSAHAQRRARKLYRCCECRAPIAPGTLYEHTSAMWDSDYKPAVYRRCLLCVDLAKAVHDADCSWLYGSLIDDARATVESYEHAAEQPAAVGRVAGLLWRLAEERAARSA